MAFRSARLRGLSSDGALFPPKTGGIGKSCSTLQASYSRESDGWAARRLPPPVPAASGPYRRKPSPRRRTQIEPRRETHPARGCYSRPVSNSSFLLLAVEVYYATSRSGEPQSMSNTSSPPRARSLWWMRRLTSGLPLKETDFTRQFSGAWLRTTMESVAGL